MLKKQIERIDAIDIIRGYFLFVIVIDHLGRFFGFYDLFTGRAHQWVSAAEGFFFVSGMMIGLVRGRKLKDKPFLESVKKVMSRGFQLYLWGVGLTLLFTLFAHFMVGMPGLKEGAFNNEPFSKLLIYAFTLRYNYGWTDFLGYYAIYMFISPLALFLLRRGYWYILLLLSTAVWYLGGNSQLGMQLLFFGGSIVGFYLPEIEHWFLHLHKKVRLFIASILITLTSLTIALSMFLNTFIDTLHNVTHYPRFGLPVEVIFNYNAHTLAPLFDRYKLAPGRILLFILWFSTLYLVVRRYEEPIKNTLGKFFIPYGQNSLYVYIVHSFFVFFSHPLFPTQTNFIVSFGVNTLVLVIIWLMIKTKFLFKIIPR